MFHAFEELRIKKKKGKMHVFPSKELGIVQVHQIHQKFIPNNRKSVNSVDFSKSLFFAKSI